MTIKNLLRRTLHLVGVEVLRTRDCPAHNLMGLRNFNFRTVIDVGANIGQFARWALKRFPEAEIFCFEPIPRAFAELQRWSSNKPRVHAYNCALGAERGRAILHVHSEHSPSSSLLSVTSRSVELFPFTAAHEPEPVDIRTLDDVFESQLPIVQEPILLKMDVQGFEEKVLDGARTALERVTACLAEVSLDPLYHGQASFAGIHDRMHAANFSYAGNFSQVYGDDGHVVYLDVLYTRGAGSRAQPQDPHMASA